MSQGQLIRTLHQAGPLTYAELAAAVYGTYPGQTPTPTQVGNVRRAVSKLARAGLVTTAAASTPVRAGRPAVRVQLTT